MNTCGNLSFMHDRWPVIANAALFNASAEVDDVPEVTPPAANSDTVGNVVTLPTIISNETFLRAVFGDIEEHERVWICAFPEKPSVSSRWAGEGHRLGAPLTFKTDICNAYYSTAVIAGAKRQKKDASRMAVLVADDVDLSILRAEPSYVIETSPGKHQAGYIIESGGDDLDKCDKVMVALGKLGLLGGADKSGNNYVRYVRLPVGVNTKPRESGPFTHRLTVWNPNLVYSLDSAAAALGIAIIPDNVEEIPTKSNTPLDEIATRAEKIGNWKRLISDPTLDSRSYHDALTEWAASKLATGSGAGAVVDELRAEMLLCKPTVEQCQAQSADYAEQIQRWQNRYDTDIPHAVVSASNKFANNSTKPSVWGAPVDLWGKIVVPSAHPVFFPQVISDYAFEVSAVSGFDPGFVAMASMVAAAGAVHDGLKIQCKLNDPTFIQDPRLWVALVGPPSAKKSPVMKHVCSRLHTIERELRDQHAKDMKEFRTAKHNWDILKALSKQSGAELPPEPEAPPLTRLVVDDTTIERLQMVLGHDPRGVIQIRDELSGWLESMGAYGDRGSAGKDQAHWLQLYDGGPRTFDRVGRGDTCDENWGASVLGGIQPETMQKIAHRLPNNGLLQRFLVVIGQRRPAEDRNMDVRVIAAFDDLIGNLHQLQPSDVRVTMSTAADDVRKRVFDRLGGLMANFENGSARLASHLGKWEGAFCRIALVVHCISCVERSEKLENVPLSVETALLVERLMFQFLLPHLMCFYEDVLGDGGGSAIDSLDDAKKLGEHILTKSWAKFTDRDVSHAVKRWRHRDIRQKAECYSKLEAMGWIRPTDNPDPRGIASGYAVNPAVHTVFAHAAKQFAEAMKLVAALLKPNQVVAEA